MKRLIASLGTLFTVTLAACVEPAPLTDEPPPTEETVPAPSDTPALTLRPTLTHTFPNEPTFTQGATLGYGALWDAALSPDESAIAAAGSAGVVVHDASTLAVRWFHPVPGYAVEHVAWSADGARVIAANQRPPTGGVTLMTLDAASGEELGSIHLSDVIDVSLSPDGSRALLSPLDFQAGEIWVYDTATGERLGALPVYVESGRLGIASWSADSTRVVLPTLMAPVAVWDLASLSPVRAFPGGYGNNIVALSPDGSRLFTSESAGSEGGPPPWEAAGSSELWEVETGTMLWQQEYHVYHAVWMPDGAALIGQRAVPGWTRIEVVRIDTENGAVSGVGETVSGRLELGPGDALLQTARDRLRLLDGATLEPLAEALNYVDDPYQETTHYMAFSPDGGQVVMASYSSLILWDVQTGQELRRWDGLTGAVAWSPDGTRIAVRGWTDSTITLLDAATGDALAAYPTLMAGSGLLRWSAPNRLFMAGSARDGGAMWALLDAASGATLADDRSDTAFWYGFAARPDGSRYAFSFHGGEEGENRTIIADARTGAEITSLATDINYAGQLAWSPDGRYLAGNSLPQLLFWEVETGERVLERGDWGASEISLVAMDWLSDDLVAGVSRSGLFHVWHVERGSVFQPRLITGSDNMDLRAYDFVHGLLLIAEPGGALTVWEISGLR